MKPDNLQSVARGDADNSGQSGTPEPATKDRQGIYIGQVRGIRFYLDYSWFLIAAIVVYSLSSFTFPYLLHGRAPSVYLAMGVIATSLFFLSILLHELGHSIVSQRCGIPVPSITLLFIGGIAEISREPDDARSELKIALAGPAVSIVLAVLYKTLAFGFGLAHLWEARLIFNWLALINIWLVIFNAIPGYPLDGGRVLRALLWMRNGKLRQATYITSRIGVIFSWLLMGLGVIAIFQGAWTGFASILVGVFLKNAAEGGYSQALFKEILDGVSTRDLMTRDPITIPAQLPLNLAVDDYFLSNYHHVAFPVVDNDGRFRGLLRLEFLKSIPREKWPYTLVGDVVEQTGSGQLRVPSETSAADAFRKLLTAGEGRLAVTEDGSRLVGIITRHDLLHYIRIHTELDDEG